MLIQYAENAVCHIEIVPYCSNLDKAVVVELHACFFLRGQVDELVEKKTIFFLFAVLLAAMFC